MSSGKVADFNAFLSVTADGESVFETREGRVVITHEDIAVAGDSESCRLSLDAIAAFDFRTVPEGWEQFFDDLVGIRFDTSEGETTVTIGADTEVADRFVTVLLKLLLDGTAAQVRQRYVPLDDGEAEQHSGESPVTLLPTSERIRFDDTGARPIDISTITGVTSEGSGAVVVRHLGEDGRLSTELTPDVARGSQFLQTYLDFRGELTESSGPIRFLYVGQDRDTLVLVAKLLKHRNIAFEAGQATSSEELFEALDSTERPTECLVMEQEVSDSRAKQLRDQLHESGYEIPLVVLSRESDGDVVIDGDERLVDTVEIESRTEHYEDIADAIQRAVRASRVS